MIVSLLCTPGRSVRYRSNPRRQLPTAAVHKSPPLPLYIPNLPKNKHLTRSRLFNTTFTGIRCYLSSTVTHLHLFGLFSLNTWQQSDSYYNTCYHIQNLIGTPTNKKPVLTIYIYYTHKTHIQKNGNNNVRKSAWCSLRLSSAPAVPSDGRDLEMLASFHLEPVGGGRCWIPHDREPSVLSAPVSAR